MELEKSAPDAEGKDITWGIEPQLFSAQAFRYVS
jgi:hypothetical protein